MLGPVNGGRAAKLPECPTNKFLNVKAEIETTFLRKQILKTLLQKPGFTTPHPPQAERPGFTNPLAEKRFP